MLVSNSKSWCAPALYRRREVEIFAPFFLLLRSAAACSPQCAAGTPELVLAWRCKWQCRSSAQFAELAHLERGADACSLPPVPGLKLGLNSGLHADVDAALWMDGGAACPVVRSHWSSLSAVP